MIGTFVEDSIRKGLKVNEYESKGMVFLGKPGLLCKVGVGGRRLDYFSEMIHFGIVLDESGKDGTGYYRKAARRRKLGCDQISREY